MNHSPSAAFGSASVSASWTFPKSARLTKRYQFRAARDGGVVHTKHFVIQVLPAVQEPPSSRLGITVTKRTCARAVARNRVKRLVREAYRMNRGLFPKADLVVIGKRGADLLQLAHVVAEFQRAKGALARAARVVRSKA